MLQRLLRSRSASRWRTIASMTAETPASAMSTDGFAVSIKPLAGYMTTPHFQNMIEEANVKEYLAVFKKQNRDRGVVTFQTEEAKRAAVELLNKLTRPDSDLPYIISDAEFIAESQRDKRVREESFERWNTKRARNSGDPSLQVTSVRPLEEVVTPWLSVTYEQQLAKKVDILRDSLTDVVKALRKDYKSDIAKYPSLDLKGVPREPVHADLHCPTTLSVASTCDIPSNANMRMACRIESVHGWSDGREGYRNKNEMTIGLDLEGKPCVGFIVGRTEGRHVVAHAGPSVIIPRVAARIAADLEAFIAESGLKSFQKLGNDAPSTGFWRKVLVRTAKTTGEVMLALQVDFGIMSEAEVASFKDDFCKRFPVDCYSKEDLDGGVEWRVTSIVVQSYGGYGTSTPMDIPFESLRGPGYIVEKLGSYSFQIQPTSFFQVNTQGANMLYNLVGDWATQTETEGTDSGRHTILVDVCCGTGTIGMTLHDRVSEVLGFEMVESAVADAQLNAERNALSRCEFIVGKAEDTLDRSIRQHLGKHPNAQVICVVDPPRPGLHKKVIQSIRSCSAIKRVVYVSCNPKSLAADVAAFIRPQTKQRPGEPFTAVKAALVDMFPHTPHLELKCILAELHGCFGAPLP
ncbi:RRM domain-containing protein [Plasmodiophora brassicae]